MPHRSRIAVRLTTSRRVRAVNGSRGKARRQGRWGSAYSRPLPAEGVMSDDENMLECWRSAREVAMAQLRALESGRLSAIARGADMTQRQIATLRQIVANYDMLIGLLGVSIVPQPTA